MIRTHALSLVIPALALTSTASWGQSQSASEPTIDRPPNIVIFLADDLGYGELGCYGQEKIRTPNIDQLAAEGMRFTQFYSGSTVCAPSRCVLMTGRHTGHSFIRGNREVGGWGPEEPEGQYPLADEQITLAELLQEHGYATCAVGKWGLGGPGSEGHPNRQGFDHFYGYLCQRVAHNYYPTHLWRNSDVDVQHGNRYFKSHQRLKAPLATEAEYDRFKGEDYAPQAIADEATQFVRDHADEPFFLYYASIIPHMALQAPDDYVDQYPRAWDEAPYLGGNGYLPTPRPRATYAAMISFLDASVGRIMQELEEQGIADDTIILFTSDNGTTFNGGVDREFFESLAGLRGHKCNLYEGGIRAPMIARWPGRIPAGSESGHIGCSYDILPTMMDLLGLPEPDDIDGISFAPALLDQGEQPAHDHLYWEYPESKQQQAVRFGDFKAIRPNLRKGDLTIELYNLAADPGEEHNLAEERPDLVERARALMSASRSPNPLFPITALDELHKSASPQVPSP